MQHVLTTEQLMQIHEALSADPVMTFRPMGRLGERRWIACFGHKLRKEAAKLVEDILNADGAKGEPDATRSDD